jgi:hypothetical protein
MSVKKEPSTRRSVPAAVGVPADAQSAVARRSADAELRVLIDKFAPAHLRLIGAVRRSLQKRLPTAYEMVYEYANQGAMLITYSPSGRGHEGVLSIRATVDGVKLYFNQGKELPDPEKLLQGYSQTRWIDVDGVSTLTRPAVVRLINEALTHNRVPFAGTGRGSIVIRSTSATKRRRRSTQHKN